MNLFPLSQIIVLEIYLSGKHNLIYLSFWLLRLKYRMYYPKSIDNEPLRNKLKFNCAQLRICTSFNQFVYKC